MTDTWQDTALSLQAQIVEMSNLLAEVGPLVCMARELGPDKTPCAGGPYKFSVDGKPYYTCAVHAADAFTEYGNRITHPRLRI